MVLAHRSELLDQTADKLAQSTGLGCATEKAEESCLGSWFRVVVGSAQTLMREKRLKQFPTDYFDTIIVDEAHHCLSDSYQRVLGHFDAKVLDVTATPDRGDMRNLGSYFESLTYEYTFPKEIKEGYLSPIKAQTIPLKLDLSGVGMQSGDFKAGDIGTALDPYLHQIADEMAKYCMDRKTVVFLPLIKTSQKFRDILQSKGFSAAEVNGDSKDRAEVLADFDSGKYHHSKGIQGGKRSMDRASGSGVFARDPDALLDLIELELSEDLLKQEENKAVCAACIDHLDRYSKTWEDHVSQDDCVPKGICWRPVTSICWEKNSIAALKNQSRRHGERYRTVPPGESKGYSESFRSFTQRIYGSITRPIKWM